MKQFIRCLEKILRAARPGLILFVLILPAWWAGVRWYQADRMRSYRILLERNLAVQVDSLTNSLHSDFSILHSLQNFVSSQDDLSDLENEFPAFAAGLLSENSSILFVSIATESGAYFVYPSDWQSQAVGESIFSGSSAENAAAGSCADCVNFEGPRSLFGKDTVILAAVPVAYRSRYLGTVGAAVDFESLLKKSNLISASSELKYAFRTLDGKPVWGSPDIFLQDPVILSIQFVPFGMEAAAVPVQGWQKSIAEDLLLFQISTLFIPALLAVIFALINNRKEDLKVLVGQRTEELQKREARYRSLFEHAGDGILIADPNGKFLEVNTSASQMLGFSKQELLNMTVADLNDPDFLMQHPLVYPHLLPGDHFIFQRLLRRKNENSILIEISIKVLPNGCHQAFLRDISEREASRKALEAVADKFSRTFNASPDGMLLVRAADGVMVDCNPAFLNAVHLSFEEVCEKPVDEFPAWPFEYPYAEIIQRLEPAGWFEDLLILKDTPGRDPRTVHLQVKRVEIAGEDCLLFVCRDITVYFEAQKALSESEARYRSLFEDSASVQLLMDPRDGQIIDANPAAVAYYGYSREVLKQMRIGDINQLTVQELAVEMEQARLQKRRYFQFCHRLASGEIRHVEVFAGPIWQNSRQLLYSTVHDIEDRVQREREQHTILKVAAALRQAENRSEMGPIILEQMMSLFAAQAAALVVSDADDRHFKIDFAVGLCASLQGQSGISICSEFIQALNESKPFDLTQSFEQGKFLSCIQYLKNYTPIEYEGKPIQYLVLPLTAQKISLGCILVGRNQPFSSQDQSILKAIADMSANALRRDALFEELVQSHEMLEDAYDTTLEGWARALELRDKETEGHSQRVTHMTVALARAMGISEADIQHVRRGALLHDIGKMGIPDSILNKPGPLDESEWQIMRQHPVYAYDLLLPIEFLNPALDIPYLHHERWDGSGYPLGLQGEAIPLPARIFAIVDVWDALLDDRPYRSAWPLEKVLAHLREQSGKHFDPAVVDCLLAYLEKNRHQLLNGFYE